MKLLKLVLIFYFCAFGAGSLAGGHPLPKIIPLPNEELPMSKEKPGLYTFRFFIPDDTSKTVINFSGVKDMAILAEKIHYDITLRLEIDQKKNVSMALDKCGMRSTTFCSSNQKETFVLSPKYFTEMENAGMIVCGEIDEPLLLLIHGEPRTSGTVSVHIKKASVSMNGIFEDFIVFMFYPLLFASIILAAGCNCPSLIFCVIEGMLRRYEQHMNGFRYRRLGVFHGHQGTNV